MIAGDSMELFGGGRNVCEGEDQSHVVSQMVIINSTAREAFHKSLPSNAKSETAGGDKETRGSIPHGQVCWSGVGVSAFGCPDERAVTLPT